jgi:uncharacterized protein (TIGR03067 family)
MKKYMLGVLVVGLLIAADDKKDDEKKDDAKDKLKGTWTFVAMEEGGQKAAADRFKDWTLTFEGDKVTFKQGTRTKMGTFKMDASAKPPQLDITPSDPNDKPMKMIFMLDGEDLKIAGAMREGGDRPKGFDDKEIRVLTLKREKK